MNPPIDLTLLPQTDPLELYRYRDGLYAVDLLTAAITEFDFFTWLAAHPSDHAAICRHFGLAARPTDVMLTLFPANQFIRRTATTASPSTVFELTDLAREHLV